MPDFEKMMSVPETAEKYGLTRFAVYAAIQTGKLPVYRLGRVKAIYSEDADRLWKDGKRRQGRPTNASRATAAESETE